MNWVQRASEFRGRAEPPGSLDQNFDARFCSQTSTKLGRVEQVSPDTLLPSFSQRPGAAPATAPTYKP